MRYTLLSTLALVFSSAVAAQDLTAAGRAYPVCSQKCLIEAVVASGCGATDTMCQCTTGLDVITSKLTSCLLSGDCSATDLAGECAMFLCVFVHVDVDADCWCV